MPSGQQKTTLVRLMLWAVPVMALTVGAYLAGAQLARLWATPLAQEVPQEISPTPTSATQLEWLVPGETAEGIFGLEGVDVRQYIPAPLPTPTPLPKSYYVVQLNDTLWSLAWQFQCTIEDLIAANAGTLESPFDQLDVGQILRIPEHSSLDEPLNCARVPERQEVITYVVRSGESLLCLAHKFGLSMATIQWANVHQLTDDPDLIYAGQTLTILPLDGVLHTVAEGETLGDIAERYQVEVTDIVAWGPNRLEPQGQLLAGQELVIPNGTLPMHLWSPVRVERPSDQATPTLEVPSDQSLPSPVASGDQATPSPMPDRPAPPGGIAYVDPFYSISAYDTGYCANPPAGWGWSGSLSWPTDSHEVHLQRGFRKGHPAIDILSPLDSPVYAADTGVVIWAGYNTWGYGNLVIIEHGGGWLTLYAHLGGVSAACGQTVRRGAVMGTIGQTGQSSFPHLHFEIRRNGYNFNPLNWLP